MDVHMIKKHYFSATSLRIFFIEESTLWIFI